MVRELVFKILLLFYVINKSIPPPPSPKLLKAVLVSPSIQFLFAIRIKDIRQCTKIPIEFFFLFSSVMSVQ